ncbi:hypothetical protein V1477_020077 [Vespula maculifrons]|uniref:Uncharacterized protein n=1 Tax=Vespula maculifrons TaxID=7453 RepID=A0ABD2AKX4_VESMC
MKRKEDKVSDRVGRLIVRQRGRTEIETPWSWRIPKSRWNQIAEEEEEEEKKEEEEEEGGGEEDNEEDVGMVYETPRESTIQSETRGPSVTTAYCSTRVHQSYACKARTVGENGGINCGTF